METKTFTQFGTFTVVLFILLIAMVFGINYFENSELTGGDIFALSLFVVILLLFYQLKITVNAKEVRFSLGIGIIGKTFQTNHIKGCRSVRNSVLSGLGVRMITNGWLYNVSGLSAVELQFKDKKAVVRIGTDQPDEVTEAIMAKIDG